MAATTNTVKRTLNPASPQYIPVALNFGFLLLAFFNYAYNYTPMKSSASIIQSSA